MSGGVSSDSIHGEFVTSNYIGGLPGDPNDAHSTPTDAHSTPNVPHSTPNFAHSTPNDDGHNTQLLLKSLN